MSRPNYIPVERAWTWETGNWFERGEMIRNHAFGYRPISNEALKSLFLLTDEGLEKILAGDIWRPEHSTDTGSVT